MGLFNKGKKSNGSLRTLSENDIQKKLYGELRPPMLPSTPPQNKPMQRLGFSQKSATLEQPSKDLFSGPAPQTQRPENKEPKGDHNRMARLEELAEAEKSKQQKAANKPQSSKPPFKMPSIPQSFWTNLSAFALSVGKFLLKAAIVLFTSLWKVVKLVDFRRPAIRRAFFGVVGAALLISVFAGIHVLNVNRERAMKNPGKTVTKQAAKPAKASRAERARGEEERSSAQETPAPAAAPAVENAAQAEPNAPKAEAETGKRYVVQVATYATAQDAERVVQDIKDSGAPAFVKALSSRSGRVYHSVFLGRFSDADEAQTYLEKFRKGNASKSFQDAFVRTLD